MFESLLALIPQRHPLFPFSEAQENTFNFLFQSSKKKKKKELTSFEILLMGLGKTYLENSMAMWQVSQQSTFIS